MSQISLCLPDSLHQYAKQLAANDDASLNQFIVMAVSEKVSAFKTEAFFQQCAALSSREKADTVLRKVRKVPPITGDELLEKS